MHNIELSDAIKDRKQSYLNGLKLFAKNRFDVNPAKQKLLLDYVTSFTIESIEFETAKEAGDNFRAFFAKVLKDASDLTGLSIDEIYEDLLIAERFFVWDLGHVTLSKPTGLFDRDGEEIAQTDTTFSCLTKEQKEEYLSIFKEEKDQPLWFRNLPEWQQKYLRKKLEGADESDIEERILTIPSSLRSVPGLANLGVHNNLRYRFSIPVPIDVERTLGLFSGLKYSIALKLPFKIFKKSVEEKRKKDELTIERIRLTVQNIDQLFESENSPLAQVIERFVERWNIEPSAKDNPIESPILIQTLISPVFEEATLVKDLEKALIEFSKKEKVYKVEIGDKTYWVKPKIIHQNHPVNFAKRLLTTYLAPLMREQASKNKIAADGLLKSIWNFLSQILPREYVYVIAHMDKSVTDFNMEHIEALRNMLEFEEKERLKTLFDALSDYVEVYQRKPGALTRLKHAFTRGSHKELFMASLEQIITTEIGGMASGSCKSGKDRKGMEILHTDAMLEYYRQYGKFPKYEDTGEDRKNFVNIFAKLFASRQAHIWSAFNSPGAFGIKGIQIFKGFRCIADSLPSDILEKIFPEKEDVDRNIVLAGLNKPKNPFSTVNPFKKWHRKKKFKTTGAKVKSGIGGRVEDERRVSTTISHGSKKTYRTDFSSKPIKWTAPEGVEFKKKDVEVFYFPAGSHARYETNTLEITGPVESQVENAWWCAVRYLEENLDVVDRGIVLDGNQEMLEALQLIFVEGLGVPIDRIKLPESSRIVIKHDRNGKIIVPDKFKEGVEQAKKSKKSFVKETDTVLVKPAAGLSEERQIKKTG